MRHAPTLSRAGTARRGTVLMSALVVVVMAAMVGTTAIYLADAEVASTRASIRATQSRALAWSAVQMAMAELAGQREALLDGGRPELTRELPGGPGAPGALARLVEAGAGEVAVPEAARLDINSATPEMLVATGLLGAEVAGRISGAAAQRPFASVEELLGIEGVAVEMVYGGGMPAPGPGPGASAPIGGVPRLPDLLTTYAFDPNIQAGVGDRGADHRGKKRINLAVEWSDSLGQAVSNRFGKDAAKILEQIMKGGTRFERPSDLVALLRRLNVPATEWGPILDTFTTSDDDYLLGRVDLSSASAAVLACVPGISADAAARIVNERDRLGADARGSVVWPLIGGILSDEEFQRAIDHLTTRCMQWRVRVEAGFLSDAALLAEESSAGVRLSDRVVLEAVIDVASRRPRVAYLRDVTLLPGAYAMYRAGAAVRAEEPEAAQDVSGQVPGPDEEDSGGLDLETDLKFGDLELGGAAEKSRGEAPGADPTVSASGPAGSNASTAGALPSPEGPAGIQGGATDRRIGRWTTGARGGGGR